MKCLVAVLLCLVPGISAFAGADDEKPIRIDSTVTQPVLIKKVQPKFPQLPKGTIIRASTIVVEAVITSKGNVANVKLLRSIHPKFDEATIAAVKQWKYKPALKEGKPVAVYFVVTTHIHLR